MMLKDPNVRWLIAAWVRLREHLTNASALATAVACVGEPSPARRRSAAIGLLVVARADRYEITNFYLSTVHYRWRQRDDTSGAPSLAEATSDGEFTAEPAAHFTLQAKSGAVLAEWNGPTARALFALGRLAGRRESSPYASPDDRFDFEFPNAELVGAE